MSQPLVLASSEVYRSVQQCNDLLDWLNSEWSRRSPKGRSSHISLSLGSMNAWMALAAGCPGRPLSPAGLPRPGHNRRKYATVYLFWVTESQRPQQIVRGNRWCSNLVLHLIRQRLSFGGRFGVHTTPFRTPGGTRCGRIGLGGRKMSRHAVSVSGGCCHRPSRRSGSADRGGLIRPSGPSQKPLCGDSIFHFCFLRFCRLLCPFWAERDHLYGLVVVARQCQEPARCASSTNRRWRTAHTRAGVPRMCCGRALAGQATHPPTTTGCQTLSPGSVRPTCPD